MKQIIRSVKGTRDFYPADLRRQKFMTDILSRVVESFGYEAYDAPLLEPLALYAAKSSAEIIERQSYVFEDRGGERLVVRPEMTPSLARMIATRERELPPLLRWYCLAECWRYERPQKGRLRNFLQLNVDLLGSDTAEADVEVLQVAIALLDDLKVSLSQIEIRINDRRLLEGWLREAEIKEEAWTPVLSLLDERDKLEVVEFRSRLTELTSASSADLLIRFFDQPLEALLLDPRAARLREIQQLLLENKTEVVLRIDPTVIRGFSYYTGMVFEVYETSGEFRRAIFGGGRYGKLIEALGGSGISGVGFGVSDVSLEALLQTQAKEMLVPSVNVAMLIPATDAEASIQRELATYLRKGGVSVRVSFPPYGFATQLKLAQKQGIEKVILLRAEEWKRGQVCIKQLADGTQQMVNRVNLLSALA